MVCSIQLKLKYYGQMSKSVREVGACVRCNSVDGLLTIASVHQACSSYSLGNLGAVENNFTVPVSMLDLSFLIQARCYVGKLLVHCWKNNVNLENVTLPCLFVCFFCEPIFLAEEQLILVEMSYKWLICMYLLTILYLTPGAAIQDR